MRLVKFTMFAVYMNLCGYVNFRCSGVTDKLNELIIKLVETIRKFVRLAYFCQ